MMLHTLREKLKATAKGKGESHDWQGDFLLRPIAVACVLLAVSVSLRGQEKELYFYKGRDFKKTDYRVYLNIYPGVLRIGKFSPGLWCAVNNDGTSLGGLTVAWSPVGVAIGRGR
jgi:hypothetical protein